MRKNLEDLDETLLKLKCKFGSLSYLKMQRQIYALKGCDSIDLNDLYDYINVYEAKVRLLRYKYKDFKETEIKYPNNIQKTGLRYFLDKECELTKCDKKFFEKVQKFL